MKERLSRAVAKLEWLLSGNGFAENVLGDIGVCFAQERLNRYFDAHQFDVGKFLTDHGKELDDLNDALRVFLTDELTGFAADLYQDLLKLTSEWPQRSQIRDHLLNRYLGFPIWDALLYPLQAYTDINERSAVRVARMSPRDAHLLKVKGETTVQGAQLGHAYAFFSREARENDYLWGRLDAAESIVRLLLTTTKDEKVIPGNEHKDYVRSCKAVFAAVLDEDKDHLPTIGTTVETIRGRIEKLKP